jgi:murein DD-endopeptidase MepM/ murein hydrolase activator NlpD
MTRRAPVDGFDAARVRSLGPRLRWLASRSDGHRFHAGVDLRAPLGTVVRAPEPARVVVNVLTRTPQEVVEHIGTARPWDGYGPRCVVLHGESGAFHVLAHLRETGGTPPLGSSLAAGVATGAVSRLAHVHWETRVMLRPPAGVATVEVSAHPADWLDGAWHVFDQAREGCPARPTSSRLTPRGCRPGHAPVEPFPPPGPVTTPEGPPVPTAPPSRLRSGGKKGKGAVDG